MKIVFRATVEINAVSNRIKESFFGAPSNIATATTI